jgi:ribosomal-protein-alanine N-acetyltransferase
VPALEILRADHAAAVLAFEKENRAFFAVSIPDRGDDFFAHYDERHSVLLAEQEAGICKFHVLVDDDGAVLGRFNLVDIEGGSAELGYRVAEKASGRGTATSAVREICELAVTQYGLTSLRARTTRENHASHTVLTRNGFVPVGEVTLSGKAGVSYLRKLAG